VSDDRYSDVEEQYLNSVRDQLESTGVFQVTVTGVPWEEFRLQIAQCTYPAYLLGWPSPGQPVSHLDPTAWTEFFVQETDQVFCSHYQSAQMDALMQAAREELEPAARLELFGEVQELWANDLPTLDITQEPRRALSLAKVQGLAADALGLLHYELLTKSGG
jgi:peptide/nickel transport system substrate-binding protein